MEIEVKWVRAGVGLPAVWMESDGLFTAFTMMGRELDRGRPLALTDPQTAFGLALKLDEWERVRNPMWPYRQGMSTLQTWVDRVTMWASTGGKSQKGCTGEMRFRAEEIGQDHHIRRSLGWKIEPGTLARFEQLSHHDWCVMIDDSKRFFGPGYRLSVNGAATYTVLPALTSIDCLLKARRIIAETPILPTYIHL